MAITIRHPLKTNPLNFNRFYFSGRTEQKKCEMNLTIKKEDCLESSFFEFTTYLF
jgi:hypothetical protein